MSFSIKSLLIYGHSGEIREVPFQVHGLNIITGKSKTGKSAIIDIVDYCLGRGSYNVAEGEIRKKVAWFALHLVKGDDHVFVARNNPGPVASTGSMVYFQRGLESGYPLLEELNKNITETGLKAFITQFAGIVENEHRPETGTRDPLKANIAHALLMCFQRQNTIASQEQLFHRINEPFLPQALKDTFPYFLGAVDEDHFQYLSELDRLSKRLRMLEIRDAKGRRVAEVSDGRITRIVNDGKRVGLIPQDYQPVTDDVLTYLKSISAVEVESTGIYTDFGETISRLRGEEMTLGNRLSELNQDLRAARAFQSVQTDFSSESTEQKARLTSVGIYKDEHADGTCCPICDSKLDVPTPTVSEMSESLGRVDGLLSTVQSESPQIQAYIDEIEINIGKNTDAIKDVQSELRRVISEDERAKAAHSQLVARARFLGRLADFLESVQPEPVDHQLASELEEVKQAIVAVQAKLNSDEVQSRIDTFLNFVGQKMTDYSAALDLEHSGSRLRLDMKKLTVVADTEDGPIPLSRMGSGENWVGYHVLTHLALHWWLRKRERPVPSFLIFDQPTQAYYPPDRSDGGLDVIEKDADRRAVHALFKLMYDASQEIDEPFQLIVLDHAHLDEDWFEDSIVEEWRGEDALVPRHWPNG